MTKPETIILHTQLNVCTNSLSLSLSLSLSHFISLSLSISPSLSYNASSSSKSEVLLQLNAYRISYLRDIYELFVELNETNNYITSITMTVEANLCKLFDAFNRLGIQSKQKSLDYTVELECGIVQPTST